VPETESTQTKSREAPVIVDPMFADVLCAIDGKEGGFSSVEHAATLTGTQGHLTFLAVTSYRAEGNYRGPAIGPARAGEILERAGAIARAAGVPYTGEVDPRSPPARIILEWSERYDLLALGAPASSWPAKLLSVGVGDQALGGFSTALLLARPLAAERRFADRIVVASDGTEGSDALIDLAAQLARPYGSTVTIVHAPGRDSPLKRGRARDHESALKEQEQALARKLASGKSELLIEPGRAAKVIVAAANRADASLVIMGSRRLDGLRAMGSVSRRVAHQARCSVLLVAPPGQ